MRPWLVEMQSREEPSSGEQVFCLFESKLSRVGVDLWGRQTIFWETQVSKQSLHWNTAKFLMWRHNFMLQSGKTLHWSEHCLFFLNSLSEWTLIALMLFVFLHLVSFQFFRGVNLNIYQLSNWRSPGCGFYPLFLNHTTYNKSWPAFQ